MGAGSYGAAILQKELDHFAKMVEQTPAGALDPMASHYLFHPESAAAKKQVTSRQLAAWQEDPRMSPQALAEREARIAQEAEQLRRQQAEREAANQLAAEQAEQWLQSQRELLAQEAERRRQEQLVAPHSLEVQLDSQAAYAVWAHSLGDRDGLRARISNVTRDPMTARRPPFNLNL
jgi:hypothetical protein